MCRWSRGRGCRLRRHKSARGVVHSGDGAEGDEDEDDDDGYGCVGVGSCQRGRTPNDDRTRRFRAWCRHVYASTWYVTARGRGGGSARQHHPACPLALYVADIIATRPPTFLAGEHRFNAYRYVTVSAGVVMACVWQHSMQVEYDACYAEHGFGGGTSQPLMVVCVARDARQHHPRQL